MKVVLSSCILVSICTFSCANSLPLPASPIASTTAAPTPHREPVIVPAVAPPPAPAAEAPAAVVPRQEPAVALTPAAPSAPAQSPLLEPSPDGLTHTVKKHEVLSKIAECHGVAQTELLKLNHLKNPDRIFVGQRLLLPGGAILREGCLQTEAPPAHIDVAHDLHVVRPGETLSLIASLHATTVPLLIEWNNLPGERINAGQRLRYTPPIRRPPPKHQDLPGDLHLVQVSDDLSRIAILHSISEDKLIEINKLKDHRLVPGQHLLYVPPDVPPEPKVKVPCPTFFVSSKTVARQVFLVDGPADALLTKYLQEAKAKAVQPDLRQLKVIFFNDRGEQQPVLAPQLGFGEMVGGMTLARKWMQVLKGARAQPRQNPAKDAQLLNADLVCGDG